MQSIADAQLTLPPFIGGAVGFLGYDIVRQIEPTVPSHQGDDDFGPDACFQRYTCIIAFDHYLNQADIIVHVDISLLSPSDYGDTFLYAMARIHKMLPELEHPMARDIQKARVYECVSQSSTQDEYEHGVHAILDHISCGDIFQAVLAQHFSVRLDVSSIDIYRALRHINPSPYMFHIDL